MTSQHRINILIVGNQLAHLRCYAEMLSEPDAHVVIATSARKVIAHLLKYEVAIVLMDVSSPDSDWLALAALIRQHPRSPQTAIIFITAEPLATLERLTDHAYGAIDCLTVPVVPAVLRAKVAVFADLYRKTRQLDSLNDELERKVQERTSALQRALRVHNEFLAMAAHELKTPITGLKASTQLILRRLQKDETSCNPWLADRLRVIDQQSLRLTQMIEQLLNATRIEQKRVIIAPEPHDVVALVANVIAAAQAKTYQHEIVFSAAPTLFAAIDQQWMEQVIANLVENAIKFTAGGKIEIAVYRSADQHFCLSVRDHGAGIPVAQRSALFQRFYQANIGEHRSGLGLGLFICKQIVEAHGGEIVAEFPEDGGSRFVVTMPALAKIPEPTVRMSPTHL